MDKEQETTGFEDFTPEQIEAASALLHGFIRDMERTVGGFTELCGECGAPTDWGEAVYDLLAGRWLCPKCRDHAVDDVLPSHGGQERDGADSEEATEEQGGEV